MPALLACTQVKHESGVRTRLHNQNQYWLLVKPIVSHAWLLLALLCICMV